MRVLQVCAVDFTAYHLLGPLLRACRDAGWTAEFACSDGPLAAKLRAEGFVHRRIPITRSASPLRLLLAMLRLAASLRRDRPDVVHTHTPVGGLVGRGAAVLAGGIRIAHTFHGLPLVGDEPSGVVERAFLVAERALAHGTRLFLSQAQGDAPRAVRLGIARAEDLVVIGNGVNVDRFAPDHAARQLARARLGLPDDAVVAVCVARLVREKGVLDLADAAVRVAHPALHVLLVGAALASDRTDVSPELDGHAAVRSLGSRWRRLGYRPDVEELLRAADIFVLPSYREGLPRSVIEAMASGLPVIASDIPACRELVDDATGILFPRGNVDALAGALDVLIADPGRRRAMGATARERALARHDERAIVARQVVLLSDLARA
jgi:glycosyltransferase involved in cell wall biosynthesis